MRGLIPSGLALAGASVLSIATFGHLYWTSTRTDARGVGAIALLPMATGLVLAWAGVGMWAARQYRDDTERAAPGMAAPLGPLMLLWAASVTMVGISAIMTAAIVWDAMQTTGPALAEATQHLVLVVVGAAIALGGARYGYTRTDTPTNGKANP